MLTARKRTDKFSRGSMWSFHENILQVILPIRNIHKTCYIDDVSRKETLLYSELLQTPRLMTLNFSIPCSNSPIMPVMMIFGRTHHRSSYKRRLHWVPHDARIRVQKSKQPRNDHGPQVNYKLILSYTSIPTIIHKDNDAISKCYIKIS